MLNNIENGVSAGVVGVTIVCIYIYSVRWLNLLIPCKHLCPTDFLSDQADNLVDSLWFCGDYSPFPLDGISSVPWQSGSRWWVPPISTASSGGTSDSVTCCKLFKIWNLYWYISRLLISTAFRYERRQATFGCIGALCIPSLRWISPEQERV